MKQRGEAKLYHRKRELKRYTAPIVIRYGALSTGLGDCEPGSGHVGTCQPGNGAGTGCEASGNGDFTKCEGSGNQAINGKCEGSGNNAAISE